jgi:hypothetical protein
MRIFILHMCLSPTSCAHSPLTRLMLEPDVPLGPDPTQPHLTRSINPPTHPRIWFPWTSRRSYPTNHPSGVPPTIFDPRRRRSSLCRPPTPATHLPRRRCSRALSPCHIFGLRHHHRHQSGRAAIPKRVIDTTIIKIVLSSHHTSWCCHRRHNTWMYIWALSKIFFS